MHITPWRDVPIADCGEGMVQLTGLTSMPWHQHLNRAGALNEIWLRIGTAQRLWAAHKYLPKGTRLLVLDAWRTIELHQTIIEEDRLDIINNPELDDVIDPRDINPKHPAPSLTGGRVGVTLCDDDLIPLDMGSPVRRVCPQARLYYYYDKRSENSKEFHKRRMLLCSVMTRAGFSSDSGAWWRYQYGTQQHHALVGGPAQYGLVTDLPGDHLPRAFNKVKYSNGE
jgi:D-alanyl-D-alanine dipeptidase